MSRCANTYIVLLYFGDVVWWVFVCVTYVVPVFLATLCGVKLSLLPIQFLCFLGDVWCLDVCYLYRFRVVERKENGSAYCGSCCGL